MNTKKKHELRKQELFVHINEIIARDGYENLTVRGVCQELNISTGTFYHYFPEKSDLAQALFHDIDDYFTNKIELTFTENEYDNLAIFFKGYAEYVINNGVETCRCISVTPLKNNAKDYLDEKRGIFQVLLGILSRGQEKEQLRFPYDITETTRMLLVILRGYSADWAKQNGNYDLLEKITIFTYTLLPALVH